MTTNEEIPQTKFFAMYRVVKATISIKRNSRAPGSTKHPSIVLAKLRRFQSKQFAGFTRRNLESYK
jgi:hypothetical protein